MKKLRSVHLYLGCTFAPMLLLFAVTGLWQTLRLAGVRMPLAMVWLSTIHTGHGLKAGTLYSISMLWFVVLMTVSLIFTIVLGILMALKFGHKQTAIYCLSAGIIVPLTLVLLSLHR